MLATASGAAGGTFGLAALPIELPVSTVIMLRSIADIAKSEGEDLEDPATALSCVEVFALGAERGLFKEGAPVLLKFVTQVAARFGVVVSQKVAAQAVPVVGALGGGLHVIDASIMPDIVSTPTNVTTIMMAEAISRRLEASDGR